MWEEMEVYKEEGRVRDKKKRMKVGTKKAGGRKVRARAAVLVMVGLAASAIAIWRGQTCGYALSAAQTPFCQERLVLDAAPHDQTDLGSGQKFGRHIFSAMAKNETGEDRRTKYKTCHYYAGGTTQQGGGCKKEPKEGGKWTVHQLKETVTKEVRETGPSRKTLQRISLKKVQKSRRRPVRKKEWKRKKTLSPWTRPPPL